MTEEIIIDGVDVAGCGYLECDTKCMIYGYGLSGEDTFCRECNGNPNCYYKQLKRLEQKNEMIINEYNKLQAEIIGDMEFKEIMLTGITPLKVLQNLKERNRELQSFYDVHESFKTDFDTNRKLLDNYRSALEEINLILDELKQQYDYITDYSEIKEIQDRINEVLQ